MRLKCACVLLPALLILVSAVSAQTKAEAGTGTGTKPAAAAAAKDYSKEAVVVESSSDVSTFANDGTGTREVTMRMRIQSEAGVRAFGVVRMAYTSGSEALTIDYLRVRKPDGSTVETPADSAQDLASDVTREAPIYSDLREKHIPVKGLSTGDVLEYRAHWEIRKPLAPGQFWVTGNLDRSAIYLEQKIQVNVPRARAVKWKSTKVQPVITETATQRTFTWNSPQLDRPSAEQQKKEAEEVKVQMRAGKLPTPDIQLSSFQTWDEVGLWYEQLQKERAQPTPELQKRAAALTKDATTQDAKIRALYDYVSLRVRYIAVDLGVGAYQPHFATEVDSNGYGDCKDKHTLLAALLQAEGIHASPALINAQRDVDQDVPSPAQFNHVITVIQTDKGPVWVDTTPEVAPYAFLLSYLRDKNALVIAATGTASLTKTPAAPPYPAVRTFKMDAKLSDAGALTGSVENTFQGSEDEVLLRFAFRQTPVEKWKELGQALSYRSGFGGEISDITTGPSDQIDQPFRVSYTYERKDLPDWSDKKVLLPLPFVSLPEAGQDSASTAPLYMGMTHADFQSTLKLPAGFQPRLPRNIDLVTDFAEYHSRSSMQGGAILSERHFVSKVENISPSQLPAYKDFAKKVDDDETRFVFLTGGGTPAADDDIRPEIWDLPDSKNEQATSKYNDARDAFLRQDVTGLIEDLRAAVELDPKFARALLWLGEIYRWQQEYDQAAKLERRAIEIVPDESIGYKTLAYTWMAAGRYEEAVSAWKDYLKAAPQDFVGMRGLANAYTQLKRYPEAIATLEQATAAYPDNAALFAALGSAYTQTGKGSQAMTAYKKAVELNPDPGMFNDAAYELAEANSNLPQALEFAQKAVGDLQKATAHATLATVTMEDARRTSQLAAYWDTLGWVYFKAGDLAQAERYLDASWKLGMSPVVAEHLGQVLEKQGKRPAAIQTYKLAYLEAMPSLPVKIGGKLIKPKIVPGSSNVLAAKIAKRLEALGQNADDVRSMVEQDELNRLRTIKLPHLTSATASGDVLILLASDRGQDEVKLLGNAAQLKTFNKNMLAGFHQPFPDNGPIRLVRRGLVGCYPYSGCTLVLMPPDAVHSVE